MSINHVIEIHRPLTTAIWKTGWSPPPPFHIFWWNLRHILWIPSCFIKQFWRKMTPLLSQHLNGAICYSASVVASIIFHYLIWTIQVCRITWISLLTAFVSTTPNHLLQLCLCLPMATDSCCRAWYHVAHRWYRLFSNWGKSKWRK